MILWEVQETIWQNAKCVKLKSSLCYQSNFCTKLRLSLNITKAIIVIFYRYAEAERMLTGSAFTKTRNSDDIETEFGGMACHVFSLLGKLYR